MQIPDFFLSDPIGFHTPALAAWLQRYDRFHAVIVSPQALEKQGLSFSDFVNGRRPYQVNEDGFAVIHVNEALSRNATGVDKLFGDTHYNDLMDELDQAAGDDAVRGILLDISSPGGSAVGAPEAAAAVAAANRQKPVVSYIETIGASAAYYLAAGSSAIVASQSAVVGSVGTIAMFMNMSDYLAKCGVEVNIITPKQSDLKASGNRYRAMTDEEENFLQSRIEAMNDDFTGFVKSNRPAVTDSSLRGQWFSGSQGAALGLVDQVGSRQDALDSLSSLADFRNYLVPFAD